MGYVDVQQIGYTLPDGRTLLDGVGFRVGEGAKVALIGANGAGKTTLLRIVTGELKPHSGAVQRVGGLGVMRQFVGRIRDETTVRELLLSLAPPALRAAAADLESAELAMMQDEDEATQLRYAQAIADYTDAGGYQAEVDWDRVCEAALSIGFERARFRPVRTLSGGEQKRLVLEALLAGPDEVLLLDEPDNYLDVPAKRWLEQRLLESPKTVLFVSHDRELLARVASRVVTLELGTGGNTAWVHGGGFADYEQARADRFERFEELRRRWDEEHAKLKELVTMLKNKATYNDTMAGRYQAAQTRLRKFEEAGPPQAVPREQRVHMRLRGGRTGKRAVVCAGLELTGLMRPFDAEVFYGERVAVLGSNGSGKSHFLRLLARGGTDPEPEHRPVSGVEIAEVAHTGLARLGARVRPGWFAQTHEHGEFLGRTLLHILGHGDEHRDGVPREEASRALARYELAAAAGNEFDTLSGGQQARFQILLLELAGANLLLLDEPTDNLDLVSAQALQDGLERFEGTVLAVTHDRWFARSFDRFLVFGADGTVTESDGPVWEQERARR
ncbi:ABC-F family ATP-binding cassette domain-containing protein [Sciscionella sediminilitoris]|uniref:ABC-F family ATP-binding cassette domain-containing protein n=1 Tax=Sciscionella sediminilitoris TaxID=1445613 RepID=UPI0004DFCBA7|nr:ATP-binding cassette domain-containing protein [Sciscionella sp. SE31]